jgi:RNA recognition motif-containing protein
MLLRTGAVGVGFRRSLVIPAVAVNYSSQVAGRTGQPGDVRRSGAMKERSEEFTRLFVQNIPQGTTWKQFLDHFRASGGKYVTLSVDQASGKFKGCGLVSYDTIASAEHAISQLNGSILNSAALSVRMDRKLPGGTATINHTPPPDNGRTRPAVLYEAPGVRGAWDNKEHLTPKKSMFAKPHSDDYTTGHNPKTNTMADRAASRDKVAHTGAPSALFARPDKSFNAVALSKIKYMKGKASSSRTRNSLRRLIRESRRVGLQTAAAAAAANASTPKKSSNITPNITRKVVVATSKRRKTAATAERKEVGRGGPAKVKASSKDRTQFRATSQTTERAPVRKVASLRKPTAHGIRAVVKPSAARPGNSVPRDSRSNRSVPQAGSVKKGSKKR